MIRLLVSFLAVCCSAVSAQDNRIDIVRHDAPELAHFGRYDIGVRTLEFNNPDQPDINDTAAGHDNPRYDRQLTVEIWYPALLGDDQSPGGSYLTTTRNTNVTATLHGRAVRDATAMPCIGPMPLVVISHGYPGNRYLMSHLGENLASKGYVVAAIDHRESTYEDQRSFWSTLYHRPIDQIFVLDEMAALSADTHSFLAGLVNADQAGIVGYSMGGYGLLINLGAGYSDSVVAHADAPPNGLALRHAASNPEFAGHVDPRIKAGFAVAPWGMSHDVWNPQDLHEITVPTFFLSGSADDTSGYENGTRAVFDNAINSDRYLLTFLNAGHNAIAPIPLPIEIQNSSDQSGASHYTDPVWDSVRSANIMIHFATAFFDLHLKGDTRKQSYLDLIPNSRDGVYAVENERPTAAHTYWLGFGEGTARGLVLEHLAPATR